MLVAILVVMCLSALLTVGAVFYIRNEFRKAVSQIRGAVASYNCPFSQIASDLRATREENEELKEKLNKLGSRVAEQTVVTDDLSARVKYRENLRPIAQGFIAGKG